MTHAARVMHYCTYMRSLHAEPQEPVLAVTYTQGMYVGARVHAFEKYQIYLRSCQTHQLCDRSIHIVYLTLLRHAFPRAQQTMHTYIPTANREQAGPSPTRTAATSQQRTESRLHADSAQGREKTEEQN